MMKIENIDFRHLMQWIMFMFVWLIFAKLYMDFDMNAKIVTIVLFFLLLYDIGRDMEWQS